MCVNKKILLGGRGKSHHDVCPVMVLLVLCDVTMIVGKPSLIPTKENLSSEQMISVFDTMTAFQPKIVQGSCFKS